MSAKRKTPSFPILPKHISKRLRRASQCPIPQEEPVTNPRSPNHEIEKSRIVLDHDIPEIIRAQPYSGPKSSRTQLALNLPPLYKLDDIYRSISKRAVELKFDDFLSHMSSRYLRIVTVCSGTESPLLALEMIQDNLRKHFDRDFNFHHLFSAEIVPFKQAYIERNFHPRLIFRDVAELKDRVAQTAYGSLEKIPKNPDILIAGFSCVDFSGLNNKRKTLDENGESGGTFWGIVRYARTYRPPMVILENVKTAPWDKIEQHWNEIGYFAIHMDVDTKAYYLPQTRERGYMFCVDRGLMKKNNLREEDMLRWTDIFADFKRPASSPAGMFLMDTDDRRLEQIEKDMALRIASSSPRTTVNWARYQVRHQSYRLDQGLGYRRPISKSQDDGTCQMPDFAWQTWVKSLPERVWDTIDVNFLRKLMEGYDMNYKERCIELSQGVEREIDSRAFGIVGCITPCGIPYITTRGGPLCGLESLALQGLPLNRLLLTQETQRELQDLAGNAMSSTVVGAAIISALIVGHKILKRGISQCVPRRKTQRHKDAVPLDSYNLVPNRMPLLSAVNFDTAGVLRQASSSARYCTCERQCLVRTPILRCKLCKSTACLECSGNPPHEYERWSALARSTPLDFVGVILEILPPRLVVSGITQESYSELRQDASVSFPFYIWNTFLEAIGRAVGDELRFLDIKRSDVWTISYEGTFSVLKLIVRAQSMHWVFFAKPADTDPALCLNREILTKPIARMVPTFGSLLDGVWEICAPLSSRCTLQVSGAGTQIQAYEAKCGLEIPEFAELKVWSQLNIQGTDEELKYLDIDIRGTYNLLPDCGTANACLHKRSAANDRSEVYLFLDPTKLGEPKNDSFVFSLEHGRNNGYAARVTIAEVSHQWRSSSVGENPKPINIYHRKWIQIQTACLSAYTPEAPIRYYNLDPENTVSISNNGCHNANITLLRLSAPTNVLDSTWGGNEWNVTNPTDSPDLVKEFSWLLQKAARFNGFQEWRKVFSDPGSMMLNTNTACTACVPTKPRILWGRSRRGWIRAYEDPHDAALYERQVKARPPPFLIFRRVDEQQHGDFRITINIQTLLHRAYERLINSTGADPVSFHWRLVPNSYDARDLIFPKFTLMSNRNNSPSMQPPSFLLTLRPEQLRSLSWMIEQERNDIEPFFEEETEETLLPSLMWRAEGRAIVERTIRGGVLADDVGYGKTAIVLGLIDTQYEMSILREPKSVPGLIPTKATLIVVPHIMVRQWQSEIEKFLGARYKVLVLQSTAALARKSICDIQNCDILLVSWSIFNTTGYYQRMQKATGTLQVPTKAGRHFDEWFVAAQVSLKDQVQILMNKGPHPFLESVRTKRQKAKDSQKPRTYVPSKRLRGKQFEQLNRNTTINTQSGFHYAEVSSAEENSDASNEVDPEVLRSRVDQFLTLLPPNLRDNSHDEEPGTDSTDEETNYNETTSQPKRSTHKRLPRVNPADTIWESGWDDHKEFNINRNDMDQSWTTLKSPLLHAFTFNRLVIDEFTYAKPDRLDPLLALHAHSKWVLSGTPPLNDFADVKTMAPFLGIHLGIDDEDIQSQNKRLKMLSKQRSKAETFQSYRTPRSEAWHRHRHEIAQRFLNCFTRRNVAEIDEIPFSEHIVLVSQSPVEKAIYLELYKQLMTYNRQLRRSNRGRFISDQVERLDEIICNSSTAEEALLKRCTSLAPQGRWDNGTPEASTCKSLIQVREQQLASLIDDLESKLKLAAWVYCARDVRHEGFHKFIESIVRHDFGDMTVTRKAYPLLKRAILTSRSDDWKFFFTHPSDNVNARSELQESDNETTRKCQPWEKKLAKGKSVHLPNKPTRVREFEPILREVTTTLRNLIVEWVLRERALRFLKTVRDVQTTCSSSKSTSTPFRCHGCQSQLNAPGETNVLGSCGHALCSFCTSDTIQREECRVDGCRGSGKRFNIITAPALGCHKEDLSSEYGGSKMDKLVEIIHGTPPAERVLLFIQFPELIEVASQALNLAQITHTTISAADRKSTQKIERFQKTRFSEDKVLILNVGSEMAAGLNLQCANHVIFLSPLLMQTQYDYDATMTQAIGRSRRYGQTKHVHVYHLLAKMTIDVNIFQERRGKNILVERGDEADFVPREEAVESEIMSCQGPSLVVDNAF